MFTPQGHGARTLLACLVINLCNTANAGGSSATLTAAVFRLNAAAPLPQADEQTCRGAREDPRAIDCKRHWIFDHCTTFAIEHKAAFEAIKDCTLEVERVTDYCAAIPPWCK